MVKFDGAGNRVWTAVYDGPANGLDYPVALAVGADGSSFVTGYTWTLSRAQQGGGDQAGFDILTLKYGADGGLLWARTYGRAGLYDIASGIAVDAEGNAYVCGTIEVTNSPDSDREGIVIKYDPGGNELWTSQYGSRGVDDVYFTKLTLGPAGKLAVCGWTRVHRGGESRLAFFVLCYDQRTPRLAIGGVPAPGVRQGCLVSPRGSRFEIQATTDFLDWHDLGSVTNWNGVTPFYDRNAGQYPARFYRAQEQKP